MENWLNPKLRFALTVLFNAPSQVDSVNSKPETFIPAEQANEKPKFTQVELVHFIFHSVVVTGEMNEKAKPTSSSSSDAADADL